jgi:hypothetical protein
MGVIVKARINDGPVLRLLLDSGAQDIVLDRRALRPKQAGESDLKLVGLGSSFANARRLAPAKLESGGLVLENCPILATDMPMREGTDGVLPMSLFAGFLVRLDLPKKALELEPYSDPERTDTNGFAFVRADQRMLFLEATVNQSATGYLLLDTGAAYNGVSPAAARAWRNYRLLNPNISLISGGGETDGFLLPRGVQFHLGSQVMNADPAVVVDLSALSKLHRFEVSGLIGYPAIRNSVVTVDYRDARVRVEGK